MLLEERHAMVLQSDLEAIGAQSMDQGTEFGWQLPSTGSHFEAQPTLSGFRAEAGGRLEYCLGLGELLCQWIELRIEASNGVFHQRNRAHQDQQVVRQAYMAPMTKTRDPQEHFRKRPIPEGQLGIFFDDFLQPLAELIALQFTFQQAQFHGYIKQPFAILIDEGQEERREIAPPASSCGQTPSQLDEPADLPGPRTINDLNRIAYLGWAISAKSPT